MSKIFITAFFLLLSSYGFSADVSVQNSSIGSYPASCTSHTIDFFGDITLGDADKLDKNLRSLESKFDPEECRSGFLMIRINSSGGDAFEAIKLGRIIRKYNLKTVIIRRAQCLSSCVFLLAGGVRRLVFGSVGIHRPYFGSLDPKLSTDAIKAKRNDFNRQIYEFLEEVDVSKNLLDVMLSVPPESMRFLTEDELQGFRLSIDDPSFDEKIVSSKAHFYNISSSEYRKRDILADKNCSFLLMENKYTDHEVCRESALTGLNRDEAKRRLNRFFSVCDPSLKTKAWIDCKRNVLVFGK
jgi:hypothetical protein